MEVRYIFFFLGALASCQQQPVSMSGYVYGPAWKPMPDVEVLLSGDMESSTTTGQNGYYEFTVPQGVYTLTPIKRQPIRNKGIDAADATEVQAFLMNGNGLNWGLYSWLAADITKDGKITAADAAAIYGAEQLTPYGLQFITGTAGVNWYVFVPFGYDFAWFGVYDLPNYPTSKTIDVQADVQQDFRGFLRGDVNGK